MMLSSAISELSAGIALAEGFYVNGSRASRNHNPGDLTIDTIGKAVGKDGIFVVYANDVDGWSALHKQVELILTDASHIYNSNMTIQEIANRYTTTDQTAWALIVANKLGISPDTKVSTLLTIAETGVGIAIVVVFAVLWYFRNHK